MTRTKIDLEMWQIECTWILPTNMRDRKGKFEWVLHEAGKNFKSL
jgi:hypothetical protein